MRRNHSENDKPVGDKNRNSQMQGLEAPAGSGHMWTTQGFKPRPVGSGNARFLNRSSCGCFLQVPQLLGGCAASVDKVNECRRWGCELSAS